MKTSTAEILPFIPERELPLDSDRPILIKPGYYEVALSTTWKGYLYGRVPKLILVFRILDEGPFFGKHLYRCYNIKGFTDRKEIIPKGWHSDFVREYSRLFGPPKKLRDIGVRQFKNKIFGCKVRTVMNDYRQRPLPKELHYSVICELTEVKVG